MTTTITIRRRPMTDLAQLKMDLAKRCVALALDFDSARNELHKRYCTVSYEADPMARVRSWQLGGTHGILGLAQDQLRAIACMLGLDAREAYALLPQEPKTLDSRGMVAPGLPVDVGDGEG